MGPVLMIPQYTLENIKEPSLKDVSGATVTKKNVMTFTPDFIIVILSTVSCTTKTPMPPVPFPVNLISWPQLEVTNMTILVLIEVKHPAPIEPSQLLNSASNSCLSSHWYKIVSSHRLNLHFLNKKKLDRILLIACAGDWRSWTIVTCNKQLSVKKQPEDSLPFNCIFDNDDDYDKDPERQEHDAYQVHRMRIMIWKIHKVCCWSIRLGSLGTLEKLTQAFIGCHLYHHFIYQIKSPTS